MKRAGNILIAVLLLTSNLAFAQAINEHPDRLQKIDVVEKLGETISTDYTFLDEQGNTVNLSTYFDDGKPVVLTFVYYRCPMLCTFVLNALAESLNQLPNWIPGEDYHLVTISINPEEGPQVATQKRENYLTMFENPAFEGQELTWHFWTSPDNNVEALAKEIGFQYYYDEEIDEYAHPAVAFLLTEDAQLSRNLYGLTYPIRDMRFGLLEASEGKIGNAIEKILLYCYRYDPDQGSYVLFAKNTMKLAGAFTVLLLGGFLGLMWKFENNRDINSKQEMQTDESAQHKGDQRA